MILIAKFKEISGLFILGKLAQNLKRTSSKVKTLLYASDREDCRTFNYEFVVLLNFDLSRVTRVCYLVIRHAHYRNRGEELNMAVL